MAKLKSLAEFGKKVEVLFKSNAVNYQQDFTTELGGAIAFTTAIDTGKATGNWTGSINQEDTSDKSIFDKSVSANPTKKKIQTQVSKSKYKDVLYISNGVKGDEGDGYIIGLENGNSKQSPHGMVLINLARSQILSREALRK